MFVYSSIYIIGNADINLFRVNFTFKNINIISLFHIIIKPDVATSKARAKSGGEGGSTSLFELRRPWIRALSYKAFPRKSISGTLLKIFFKT